MTLAAARLSDVTAWARGNLILMVLLVIGTILLTRFASWAAGRYLARIDAQASDSDELVRSETLKHRHAVTQVVTWSLLVIIYCVVAVLIIQLLGLPVSRFVAPASIIGVAIGFGAQRVVQDILAGFFIVSERQYGYGDIITVAVTGNNTLSTGTVEEVTLRTTRIRSLSGEVITTPNGQIVQITNLSRDWARVVVDVPVPARVDVGHVTSLLRQVGRELYEEAEMRPLLLDPPSVMGVESLEVEQVNVRMVARTLPGKQFEVGRDLRARVVQAFRAQGMALLAQPDDAPTAVEQ